MKFNRLRVAIETVEAYAADPLSCYLMDASEFNDRLWCVASAARQTLGKIAPPRTDTTYAFWLGKDGEAP